MSPRHLSHNEILERNIERMQRRKLRWCVIRQYKIVESLKYSYHLSEIKKLLNDWNTTKGITANVDGICLEKHDFEVIHRFIRYEQAFRRCEQDDIPEITIEHYHKLQKLHIEEYLLLTYDNYESYWDEVLLSYKRPSYKIRRIQEIIKTLTKDLMDPLTDYYAVRNKISHLIEKYSNNNVR